MSNINERAAEKIKEAIEAVERKDMYDWMPIGEGVPPVGMPLILTIEDGYRHERELRYPVYYQKSPYDGKYGFFVHGREDYQLDPEYSKVLAWILMPEIWEGEEE